MFRNTLNRMVLVGYIGRNPEVDRDGDGEVVTHFSVATSRTVRRDDDVVEERTEWHRVVLRGEQMAAFAEESLRKGDRVYIEGRMVYDSFERKGITIPTAEIDVTELIRLGTAGGA